MPVELTPNGTRGMQMPKIPKPLEKVMFGMFATVQRREVSEPATVAAFAETVGTQERLQRLCLLTYADIHAVNPEALTPWKAEMLGQLFVATANHFTKTPDR